MVFGMLGLLKYRYFFLIWTVALLILYYVPGISQSALTIASLAAGLSLAAMSWKLVEGPVLRLKARIRGTPMAMPVSL